ncbi:MAG: polysaccharide deacetylase family protein [Candidatus Rokubacteria bacterium]|nr:polysaccharide deacetylase family protein [Candidatus Rokubacteria bacterium]
MNRAVGAGSQGSASDSLPVPVLMYHDLVDAPRESPAAHRPYVVPVGAFREQLRLLKEVGVVGRRLDDLLDSRPGPAGSARTCVLTFDDGHESNFTLALPLLLEAGFRATFYVTVGWIGRPPYMAWEQIKALAAAGMEIGSHSLTHRPPATLQRADLQIEMAESKKRLEDRLGLSVVSASSPTGFFNSEMIPVVQALGYRGLCTGRIALWRHPLERFRIPRIPVKLRTTPAEFGRMVLGDRWLLWRLRGEQIVRDGLKAALGVEGYSRLRRTLLRLVGPRAK